MLKNFVELWEYRELLLALTMREIKVRYKQTFFGAAWAILQPAALTIIFTVIFSIFLKVPSENTPYPVFAYSALLPWTFFTTAVSFGALSVVNNGSLVTRVYFPREVLPLATVGAAIFDFFMASIVFIILALIFQIHFSVNLLFVLLILPAIIMFATGISLLLSCLNVLFRDVRFIVPLLLQIWLYVTPVIYSLSQIPDKFRFLIFLNPMAPLVQGFRESTALGKAPNLSYLFFALGFSLFTLILSYWFFKTREKIFADII